LDDLNPVLLTCAFPEPKPGNLRRLPPPEPLLEGAGDLRLFPPPEAELLANGAEADAEATPLRPLLAELAELLAMAEPEDADATPLRPLPVPLPVPVPTDEAGAEAEAEAVG
jgi:hypothetical protein